MNDEKEFIMQKFYKLLRRNKKKIFRIFLFIFTVFLIVLLFPHEGRFKYEFQLGKPWLHEDLIAPFDFPIKKSESQLQKERAKILENFNPYFKVDNKVYPSKRNALEEKFDVAWKEKYEGADLEEDIYETNKQLILQIFDTIYKKGIIRYNKIIENKDEDFTINVLRNNISEPKELSELHNINEADKFIEKTLKNVQDSSIDQALLLRLLKSSITPNIFFDPGTTKSARKEKLSNVSLTHGLVQKGEIIIQKGELITKEKYQVLESLKEEYEVLLGGSSRYIMIVAGQAILVLISIIVLFLYLASFWHKVFSSNQRILFILLIIFIMVFITSMTIKYNVDLLYLLPVCIVPIIVRVFFDTRLALFIHIVTIIIIGFLVPNSFQFIFMHLIAGIIAIVSIVDMRRRSQLFVTAVLIFLTYSAIHVGLSFMQTGNLENTQLENFAWFAGSALLTLFSYPLIYIFEKAFGFVTNVTLMELSDTNSKLLRLLSLKAPGTFQHSMQVANIAEAVIYEIGGNPLLVRTGALYHDIGKMDMPAYFIENQRKGFNPHDKLSYEESAKIIISHVDRGVKKARKIGLPEKIVDFIRTHHGTTTTLYFYNMFKRDNPDADIDKDIFTYSGPIPFSKETAILMMVDSVEAASRSLKAPDEKTISSLVDSIIDSQIEQNQFINADITFKDITIIKRICKKMLMSIYHVRIEYPDSE